jgi:hypothetical protein
MNVNAASSRLIGNLRVIAQRRAGRLAFGLGAQAPSVCGLAI